MKTTPLMAERKEKTLMKLSERYYGKKDLLQEWELYPDIDMDYLADLRRRVRGYENQLCYRGVDGFKETK